MSGQQKTNSGTGGDSQFERFLETARELGCDEDKERFEAQLGKIATHKPAKDKEDRDPKKKSKRSK